MAGAIVTASAMPTSDPDRFVLFQQFANPANPQSHHDTTGLEIWASNNGPVNVLVAGVGPGGTVTGVSRYIKQTLAKSFTTVAVEPVSNPVITQTLEVEEPQPGAHSIAGIGAGFVPGNLDLSLIDRVETVSDADVIAMARS